NIWGRVRFREMDESYDAFTTWFIPQFEKYQELFDDPASFPSGHTSNATVIMMIIFLPVLFEKFKGKDKLLYTTAIAWIGLVAVSRIVMGAHFASDVTMGAAVSFCCLFAMCKLFKIKELKQIEFLNQS